MVVCAFFLIAFCIKASAGPRIACQNQEYKFGERQDTGTVEHVFVITNTGDAPLVLGKARGCCGASVGIAENAIAPGSNTTMKVTLDLGGRNGEVKKSIYVASNDPKEPYLQVQLSGTVTAAVLVKPDLVDFGCTTSNEVVEREVMITSLPTFPLRVTNVVSAGSQFRAEVSAASNNFCRILVHTVPPLPQGVTFGTITALTDNARRPSLEIPVLVTVSSDIIVVPGTINLALTGGQPLHVSRFFALRSRCGAAFKIAKIETPDPGIESVISPLASGGWRCELRNILPFAELDGKQVIVTTDHPTCRSIAIPIHVVVGPGR